MKTTEHKWEYGMEPNGDEPGVAREQYHDCKGVPIYAGDLIRTDHFRDRRRKLHYLYHGVRERDGALEMVPVTELATGKKDGGCCWLKAIISDRTITVLAGEMCVEDRKRVSADVVAGQVKGRA